MTIADGISDKRSDICAKETRLREGAQVPWEASGEMTGEVRNQPHLSAHTCRPVLDRAGGRVVWTLTGLDKAPASRVWAGWEQRGWAPADKLHFCSSHSSWAPVLISFRLCRKQHKAQVANWGTVSISSLCQTVPPRWPPKGPHRHRGLTLYLGWDRV